MNDTKMLTPEEIKARLDQCYSTTQYHRHNSGIMVYTDGVKEMAELCQAFWLLDIVASCQTLDICKHEEFHVYKLQVHEDNQATVKATDGNENILYKQEIPHTDFPLEKMTLYYNNHEQNQRMYKAGICYLPSEH